MISPVAFVSQVRRELQRVTWPSQKETFGMAISVVVMVICSMIYFFLTDSVVYYCVCKILEI